MPGHRSSSRMAIPKGLHILAIPRYPALGDARVRPKLMVQILTSIFGGKGYPVVLIGIRRWG